jgi:hypothetical protein
MIIFGCRMAVESKPENFLELAFNLLLSFPTDGAKRITQAVFIQRKNIVTLADGCVVKTIRTIENHIHRFSPAAKRIASQRIDDVSV